MANHISHAGLPFPVRRCRYTVMLPYLDADGDPIDGSSTLDTELSIDNATWADAAEEVTFATGGRGLGMITLTGQETNNSYVGIFGGNGGAAKAPLAAIYPRSLPVIFSGTASAGSASSLTLDSGCPALTDVLVGCIIRIFGGTGGGGTGGTNNQGRVIMSYTAGRVAGVQPDWEVTPDATSTYEILLTEMSIISLADVMLWNRTALAAPDTAGHPKVTIKDGTGVGEIDTASGKVSLANGGITNATFAAGAIDAAAIAFAAFTAAKFATNAIDANALATDAVTEITDAMLVAILANAALMTRLGILGVGTLTAGTTSSVTIPSGQRNGVAEQIAIFITSGAALGECKVLASYNSSTGVGSPAAGDEFTNAPGLANFVTFIVPTNVALVDSDFDVSFYTEVVDTLALRNYRGGSDVAPTFADVLAHGAGEINLGAGATLTIYHSDGSTIAVGPKTITRATLGAIIQST